ncbi:MAG TPA: BON domain-containing protein [Verrucomicrobiae bacterium]|nr:BON domain-containing protein [Verrucomicrobiae bacterium]
MRIPVNSLKCFGAAALLALAIGATGCHSNPDRTTGQAINDKMIKLNVDHALSSDAVLKYPDVHVQVYNGQAQLTGFVDTEGQRKRAAEIAANVPGVTQVINEITLKPTPTGRAPIRDATGDVNHPNPNYNETQPPPR